MSINRISGLVDLSEPDEGGGGHPDNSLPPGIWGGGTGGSGGLPPGWWTKPPRDQIGHPIVLPPLPGILPPPGQISLPIVLPPHIGIPVFPGPPIYIDPPEDKPNPVPPGEVYPPLNPIYGGKLVAIVVLGEGVVHWYHVPEPKK